MDDVLLNFKGQEVLSDAVITQTERNLVKGDPSHQGFLDHRQYFSCSTMENMQLQSQIKHWYMYNEILLIAAAIASWLDIT